MHWTTAGLWLAVIASGLYHGVNPGMGWPLAVSAGLMGRSRKDLMARARDACVRAPSGNACHSPALCVRGRTAGWQRDIRLGASVAVIAFGLFLLIKRRHPRALARIKPTQLALWSFAIATAHGAGLMLLPIYFGLCVPRAQIGHQAMSILMAQSLAMALLVSAVHALAMVTAGGVIALLVYLWLDLKFLSRSGSISTSSGRSA